MAENEIVPLEKKLEKLSPKLRSMIRTQAERDHEIDDMLSFCKSYRGETGGIITDFLGRTMLHCNAGATLETAFWLKKHLDNGGKLVITVAGALSSFQIGILLSELINQGKVHLISATGANHEESYYRFVAHSYYGYIANYPELTPEQEVELRDAELRRITDTFLPELESVRLLEPPVTEMIREEGKKIQVINDPELGIMLEGGRHFPSEYFRRLLTDDLIKGDPAGKPECCWTLAAQQKGIPIIVPGFEDSTMGNIISSYTYAGPHKRADLGRLNPFAIKTGLEYMHELYDWYMKNSQDSKIAFLQLGGGISADFPICVVPSLKHDNMLENVRDWAGFIEINTSHMSQGSYTGAGGKEKMTWDKLSVDSFYKIIQSDVTLAFPLIAAVLLGK